MITLPRISREQIDACPVNKAGLPPRAVNSLTRAKIGTLGQLRPFTGAQLCKLQGFGVESLQAVRQMFKVTEQLEAGKVSYANLEVFLGSLLKPAVREVIEHRYGLRRVWDDFRGPRATLQDFGTKKHLTRERVRQLQEVGEQQIESLLSRLVLHRLADYLVDRMMVNGRFQTIATLNKWQDRMLGGYLASGAFWLIHKHTGKLRFRFGFFTLVRDEEIDVVHAATQHVLRSVSVPQPIGRILSEVRADEELVRVLLDRDPTIAATKRNDFFLMKEHAPLLMEQFLRVYKGPMHYRQLAMMFNAMVKARYHQRPGRMLYYVQRSPRCERLGQGFYRFQAG